MNIKESEKIDKYLNLARKIKEMWNMRVKVTPILLGALNDAQELDERTGEVGN